MCECVYVTHRELVSVYLAGEALITGRLWTKRHQRERVRERGEKTEREGEVEGEREQQRERQECVCV